MKVLATNRGTDMSELLRATIALQDDSIEMLERENERLQELIENDKTDMIMTHSGGKPHAVGDRGQRYEVSFFDGEKRQVYGWTDDAETARKMGDSIDKHPVWGFPQVRDREADMRLRMELTAAQKRMKDFDKDWCLDAAEREDGQEVGVDNLPGPLVDLRLKLTAAQQEISRLTAEKSEAIQNFAEQVRENERLQELTENDGKEIGSYTKGTGLRGENQRLQARIDRLEEESERFYCELCGCAECLEREALSDGD